MSTDFLGGILAECIKVKHLYLSLILLVTEIYLKET